MSTSVKIRILVVDDHELARKEISRVLANLGYTNVEEAEDGHKALGLLRQGVQSGQLFRLVICDWTMPNVSGLDVLKEARKDEKLQRPAFMMVTAEAGMEFVMEALGAGADDYLIKPVAPDVLQKKIKRILTRMGL